LTAREVEEFIWNDHFVVPVISTGGAAAGDFGVPLKIFESPRGVNEADWRALSNKDANPTDVAKAMVRIVLTVKQNIAQHAASRLEQKAKVTVTAASKFKAKLRRSSKKRTPPVVEKLDLSVASGQIGHGLSNNNLNGPDDVPRSPDKVLPMNPIVDKMSSPDTSLEEVKGQKDSRWKQMGRMITFTKKPC
jgi:hypothetical protein